MRWPHLLRTWTLGAFAFSILMGVGSGVGCASRRPTAAPRKTGPIAELHLLSMPVAVNLDTRPGVDGFAIKIYALSRGNPKPTAITKGTLEILMYDGTFGGAGPEDRQPLHRWTFTADLLDAHQFRTTIGIGYAFTLAWETDRPQENRITAVARYVPPQGDAVYSSPSSLSVAFTDKNAKPGNRELP